MTGVLTLDDAVVPLRWAEDVGLHDYAGGILAAMNKAGTFFRDFRANLFQCDSGIAPITKLSTLDIRGRDTAGAQVDVAQVINNVTTPYMNVYYGGDFTFLADKGIALSSHGKLRVGSFTRAEGLPAAGVGYMDHIYMLLDDAGGSNPDEMHICISDGASPPNFSWKKFTLT